MEKIKKLIEKIFDIIEVVIPTIALLVLFTTYCINILFRYVFDSTVLWMNELSTYAYMWVAVFAASYGSRKGTSVAFTIVYDQVSEKVQRIFRIIGNSLICVIFMILIPAAHESVTFMNIRKSPVMKIPFGYVFFPALVFVILIVIHHGIALIQDIKSCFHTRKENC
ncbi:MAG: TRAP transporter small permease [Eubacteriales bacterium]